MKRRESIICAARIVKLLLRYSGQDLQQKEIIAALIDQHYPTTITRTLGYLSEPKFGFIEKKTRPRIKGERGKPPVLYQLKGVKP